MSSPTIPPVVDERLQRGRRTMRKDAPKRRLAMRFEKGDTYHYITSRNVLTNQATVTDPSGRGKPPHRIRNTYNFIRPIVDAKVSAATQRIPSYSITPTSTDQRAFEAAGLAELVARYGYDQWRLRNISLKTVKLAITAGDAFALPYFDPNIGPFTELQDGTHVGRGEVKVLVLSGNEVFWEAGAEFDDSRWYAIERARPIDDIKATPGFMGGTIEPDATMADLPTDREPGDNLALTTEYFERPSKKYPQGRCMTFVAGKPIVDYRLTNAGRDSRDWWGRYPLVDADGTVLDEPLLHRLVYTVNADSDRDLGLVWQLIDFQRTAQDCCNKILEYKNRKLNPQMKAPVGSIVTPPDDVPGAIRYYRPIGGLQPEWERDTDIPQGLFTTLEWAIQSMRDIASDQQVDPAPNLAARTLDTAIEQSQNRWQSFLGNLAEWHSRLMRHCLVLVARHYTEPRLLELQGRDGWQLVQNFKGAHLMGQTQVRVLPDSLQPITRAGIQERLGWINQNWPGWLTPEAALAALDGGNADRLIQSYWLDMSQANAVIQKIVDGTVMDMPVRSDLMPDGSELHVPSYMPSPASNLNVWKQVFGDFLKTDSMTRLPAPMQTVAQQIWAGIQWLEQQRAQQQAALQTQMAEQAGLMNAAKPQNGAKPMPSLPGSGQVPAPA